MAKERRRRRRRNREEIQEQEEHGGNVKKNVLKHSKGGFLVRVFADGAKNLQGSIVASKDGLVGVKFKRLGGTVVGYYPEEAVKVNRPGLVCIEGGLPLEEFFAVAVKRKGNQIFAKTLDGQVVTLNTLNVEILADIQVGKEEEEKKDEEGEDENDEPKKKKKKDEDEDEEDEDKPKKKKDEDEDEDEDKPKKKKADDEDWNI